jgi:hypothetical protein
MSADEGAKGIGAVYVEKDTPVPPDAREPDGFAACLPATSTDNATLPADNVVVPAGGFKS